MIAKSTDDGLSWGFPDNITSQTTRPEWWLFAPAPGQGITLTDGTLVFPTQGRDENGLPFSNITYSKDHGKTWVTSNPAYQDVTECSVVQLGDGALMLNMRDNRNRGNKDVNGRRICTTIDLGESWKEHPTSRRALVDDGMIWPEEHWILFDQYRSAGYSCITSIDENSIGILYESSQSDLAFIKINLIEILK